MGAQLRWLDLDDEARLPWVAIGDPDAPVVVALPGLSDGLMPLSEPRPRAAITGADTRDLPFRILAISHRHPVRPGTTTRDLARDAATFIEREVGAPVTVTGHSMGGMVAQWLAADHPRHVRHLVLTATLARPDDGMREVLAHWEDLVCDRRWRAFAAAANAASYTGSELLRRRLLLRLTRPPSAPHLVGRHVALTEACRTHDTRPVLGEVRAPTLVLAGEHDPVVAPTSSRALADAIGPASFVVLDGLAHGFPEQAAQRTLTVVSDWLRQQGEVAA